MSVAVAMETGYEDDDNLFTPLPANFALSGMMGNEPKMLDKALQGPYAKEWQVVYDYEISQLEKLGTWKIVDLPLRWKSNRVSHLTRKH